MVAEVTTRPLGDPATLGERRRLADEANATLAAIRGAGRIFECHLCSNWVAVEDMHIQFVQANHITSYAKPEGHLEKLCMRCVEHLKEYYGHSNRECLASCSGCAEERAAAQDEATAGAAQ